MPVPIVAPTPNIVSWNVPIVRSRRGPCGCGALAHGLAAPQLPRNPLRTVEVLIWLRSEVARRAAPAVGAS